MRSHTYYASGEVRHRDADFPTEHLQYGPAEVHRRLLRSVAVNSAHSLTGSFSLVGLFLLGGEHLVDVVDYRDNLVVKLA